MQRRNKSANFAACTGSSVSVTTSDNRTNAGWSPVGALKLEPSRSLSIASHSAIRTTSEVGLKDHSLDAASSIPFRRCSLLTDSEGMGSKVKSAPVRSPFLFFSLSDHPLTDKRRTVQHEDSLVFPRIEKADSIYIH